MSIALRNHYDYATLGAVSPHFGRILKLERTARGMSQDELAADAGVSAASIKNFEQSRQHRPRGDTVMRLLTSLHRNSPLDRAAAESMLTTAGLQAGLAQKLYNTAKPITLSPTAQLAYRSLDAMMQHVGEERALGILQSFMLAAGIPLGSGHTLKPSNPSPVPGSVAIDHPEGVREYIPTAAPSMRSHRPYSAGSSPPPPTPAPGAAGGTPAAARKARAK